jgi:hypothetical protein
MVGKSRQVYFLYGRLAEMVGKSRQVYVLNGRLAGSVGKSVEEHMCLMVGRMVVEHMY